MTGYHFPRLSRRVQAVLQYPAVLDAHHPPGGGGYARIVGDEDHRMPLGAEGFENTQNFFARPGIQIAGGLVGQDQRGMGGDGPGDGRALLLPAGHLGGPVIHPFLQPHLPQAFHGHMPPFLAADAPVDQRQLHIFAVSPGTRLKP